MQGLGGIPVLAFATDDPFMVLLIVFGLLGFFCLCLFGMGMTVYLVMHAIRRTDITPGKRVLWILLMFSIFPFGFIFYHYLSNPRYPIE